MSGKKRNASSRRQTTPNPKKLNHKLDKLHDQLVSVKQTYRREERRPAYRPLLRRSYHPQYGTTYEVITTPARITFKITNSYYIQWKPTEQNIIIRAPHHFDKTTRWQDQQGRRIQEVTHSSDYAKHIIIRGFHIGQMIGAHFHIRPAYGHQNILIEERIYFDNGIKLRLTKRASQRSLVIPKGAYLGNLYIIIPMIAKID